MNELQTAVIRISKISGVPVDQVEILINQICAIGEVREIDYKRLIYYGMRDEGLFIGMSVTDFKIWIINKWSKLDKL